MSLRVTHKLNTRRCRWLGAGLLLLLSWGAAQEQPRPGQTSTGEQGAGQTEQQNDVGLPAVTQTTTRAELLGLLDQVQTQIEALSKEELSKEPSRDAPPETDEQLLALRGQLEVLLLQAQLEQLQRENAALQGQLSTPAPAQGAGSGSAAPNAPDAAVLEQQIEQLKARQNNMTSQMEVIAHQHAEILEYSDLEEYEAKTYQVKVGDSLSALALEYYDDAVRWPDILKANPEVTDPDVLTPGTTLTIPALASERASN